MKSKQLWLTTRIFAVLVLAVGTSTLAQAPMPEHLSGIINDYTPATGVGGPWEMRGKWSLKMKGESEKADFSAVMTMEHPDYWIVLNPANVDNPGTRSAHTHHITMTDATVSYDTGVCPANNPPTSSSGLVVTGPASITGNGSPAPFEAKGPSTLQVCITGGTEVQFSNVTLVLTGPATGHFGTQAIHGVVRVVRSSNDDHSDKH